jgi:hypothetical protein
LPQVRDLLYAVPAPAGKLANWSRVPGQIMITR